MSELRSTVEPMFEGTYHSCDRSWQRFVLPHAYHKPTSFLERHRHKPVAVHIAAQLRGPVPLIGRRLPPMLGTYVPEAAVNEDCDLPCREDDVRANLDPAFKDQPKVLAVSVTKAMQRLTESNLRFGIRSPVGLHVAGPTKTRRRRVGAFGVRLGPNYFAIISRHDRRSPSLHRPRTAMRKDTPTTAIQPASPRKVTEHA